MVPVGAVSDGVLVVGAGVDELGAGPLGVDVVGVVGLIGPGTGVLRVPVPDPDPSAGVVAVDEPELVSLGAEPDVVVEPDGGGVVELCVG
jgi:hypothetical protein